MAKALSDRNEELTAVNIGLKLKLEASSQASREKEVAMKTFRTTWSNDLKKLKEVHENFIKGLQEEWRVPQKESEEKLSSCEAEKRELRKKVLEFEGLLKDEKEKGAGQDELIKALMKEVADCRNWTKSTLERFSPRLARRGIHVPQTESETE